MKNQARHFGRLRRAEMCTAYIFILPMFAGLLLFSICLLYTSQSPRDLSTSRMPSSA